MRHQLTPLEKVQRVKLAIMRHVKFCAFSGVLACGETKVDPDLPMPTAATDGWNIMFHPDFVEKCSEQELRGVVLHEGVHIACRHLTMWKALFEENRMLANIAADLYVNLALTEMDNGEGFLAFPEGGVPIMPEYHGWSVAMIYDDLKKKGKSGGGKGKGGSGGDMGNGFDDHMQPAKPESEAARQAQEEIERHRAGEIDRALRQGEMIARKRGKGEGNRSGVIGDILAPKVDWREQLREFVQEQCQGRDEATWRKPNRRFIADDVYMPSMYSEQMGELVVGIDTSGSCFSGDVLTRFVSELKAVVDAVNPEAVRVVCWDYGIRTDQTFERGQFDVPGLTVRGGGGTDGSLLFEHLREKQARPAAIIQFTDGYVGDWGHTDIPTLWVITERNIRAPWGTSINMEI